jgi:cyanophycinase
MRSFLIGGGRDPQEVQAAYAPFVDATAGGDILALVLDEGDDTDVPRWQNALRAVPGAGAVRAVVVSRERPPTREDVLGATGIFVAGGWTPEYQGALVTAAGGGWLEAAREAGAVYGGFSAGAAVAAKEALVGGWKDVIDGRDYPVCAEEAGEDLGTIELRRGLGVVEAVIDVHAAQWGTLSRLVHAVGLADGDVGYAIDENTTLELEDEAVTVHGAGLVHRVQSQPDGSVRVEILAPPAE